MRFYYSSQQYKEMEQHIDILTVKYAVETFVWNSNCNSFPTTYKQTYENAENFLKTKGISCCRKKDIIYPKIGNRCDKPAFYSVYYFYEKVFKSFNKK